MHMFEYCLYNKAIGVYYVNPVNIIKSMVFIHKDFSREFEK